MYPELGHHLAARAVCRADHEHPLEDLAQIPQVEGVMALSRGRQELLADALIALEGAIHDSLDHALVLRGEPVTEESREDGRENGLDHIVARRRNTEHGEVPEESWGHLLSATPRGCAGRTQSGLLDVLPEKLLPVIEALEVLELPQKLYGRLSSVSLTGRHVHVIHKEDYLFANRSSQTSLAFLLELALNEQLRVHSLRLCAEVYHMGGQILALPQAL
mmetsp:Transcript_23011/g.55073  ORF Transcript_23011/g.55073 Transcript_23011/m.55073 type:complete len:219 (-) Transcript_23011:287-943(-)